MRTCFWVGLLLVVCVSTVSAQSLTITATQPLGPFALDRDPTLPQTLGIRTEWTRFVRTITVCVYMSSPLSGTPGNTNTIPASSVRINGTSIVTGSTNCGVPNATQVAMEAVQVGKSSRTDDVTIDLASYPAALPPDTYTGAIYLVAAVQ